MKLRFATLIILTVVIGFTVADSFFNKGFTTPNGAPTARCGSVAHPLTCTDCHSGGSNAVQAGWITSTIPAGGYIPGTTYTITATATSSGRTTYGFELTAENSAGVKKGTFIITNATKTKSLSTGVYVTQTSSGISWPTGTASWSFNWTAPAAGTGTVTFYGAFLCANGNTTESGDLTFKANLPVTENITTGIADNNSIVSSAVNVYPNPAADHVDVDYRLSQKGSVEIKLYDINGRVIAPLLSDFKTAGDYHHSFQLPLSMNDGIYFVEISTETGKVVKRILVQQ